VNQNPNIHCIFNNPLTNGLFNADYDGDAMNIYALPDITAESEVMQMSSTKRWTISSVTGKLQLNLYEDTIFMSYKLSLDQTKMCKAMALQYFKNTKSIPNFENKSYSDMVSGKEIISQVLPKDINYNKTPAFFNRGLAGFIEYEDQHKHVEVVDGNITRGIVDKSFGQILQKIYHKHSQTETFNTLYDIQ
jgi:DNA-directed RNA polymerase beta' subunit